MGIFDIFKKNKRLQTPVDLSVLKCDVHSHLVPNVDDGSKDLDDSLNMIGELQAMGYSKIITTPHIIMDRYPNSRETMAGPYREVTSALSAENIPVSFHHAAEYYMDEQFMPLLEKPLLTLSGNMVLVEISFMSAPPQLHQWLFDIQAAGYQPVLAHPERYGYYHKNFEVYRQLKQQGCLLQVNLLSLTGYYGKHVQLAAEKLMAGGLVDLTGTDLHHEKHLQAIISIGRNKKLRKTLDSYPFRNRELTGLPD